MSKTFKGVQALKEVSLELSSGEVFTILGHNGAGKSTMINILTGDLLPSHGKTFILGKDVTEESSIIQQSVGFCPQDNIGWDDLTAKEMMYLVAKFKGIKWGNKLKEAVQQVLDSVNLLDREDHFVNTFSGGMIRRLNVAMSTVGDVGIILLDEPTTGVDPIARRKVW